jgi:hypothetical protein
VVRIFSNDILEPIQAEGKSLMVRLYSNHIMEPNQHRKKEKSLMVRLFTNPRTKKMFHKV